MAQLSDLAARLDTLDEHGQYRDDNAAGRMRGGVDKNYVLTSRAR